MNLFQLIAKKKEYYLLRDWRVTLSGEYELIDNGDSIQMASKDGDRVIYSSSFLINGSDDARREIHYLDLEKKVESSYDLAASVIQGNEALTIVITYTDPLDEEWAKSVIESAHRN